MQHGPDREFWEIARPQREPSQSRRFLVGVALAILISTPWYLPSELAARPAFGLPVWVWCSLLGGVMLACCTSWAALRAWSDSPPSSDRSSVENR